MSGLKVLPPLAASQALPPTQAELKRALRNNELVLHYQPRVSLKDETLTGFEALVRWEHPERGLLYPREFVPAADTSGLNIPVSQWILKEACRQLALWQKMFPVNPPLTIGINTSFRYLMSAALIPDVRHLLEESGLAPGALRLEMSENSIIDHLHGADAVLRELKALRVGLEVDNFGTGHSSIGYLHRLPFDTLKIDRSFVKELGTQNDSSAIIHLILTCVRSLGMEVAAAGVETHKQVSDLRALGCRLGQGAWFSRPLCAARAGELIADEVAQRENDGRGGF